MSLSLAVLCHRLSQGFGFGSNPTDRQADSRSLHHRCSNRPGVLVSARLYGGVNLFLNTMQGAVVIHQVAERDHQRQRHSWNDALDILRAYSQCGATDCVPYPEPGVPRLVAGQLRYAATIAEYNTGSAFDLSAGGFDACSICVEEAQYFICRFRLLSLCELDLCHRGPPSQRAGYQCHCAASNTASHRASKGDPISSYVPQQKWDYGHTQGHTQKSADNQQSKRSSQESQPHSERLAGHLRFVEGVEFSVWRLGRPNA